MCACAGCFERNYLDEVCAMACGEQETFGGAPHWSSLADLNSIHEGHGLCLDCVRSIFAEDSNPQCPQCGIPIEIPMNDFLRAETKYIVSISQVLSLSFLCRVASSRDSNSGPISESHICLDMQNKLRQQLQDVARERARAEKIQNRLIHESNTYMQEMSALMSEIFDSGQNGKSQSEFVILLSLHLLITSYGPITSTGYMSPVPSHLDGRNTGSQDASIPSDPFSTAVPKPSVQSFIPRAIQNEQSDDGYRYCPNEGSQFAILCPRPEVSSPEIPSARFHCNR